jgi:hypothetical protein
MLELPNHNQPNNVEYPAGFPDVRLDMDDIGTYWNYSLYLRPSTMMAFPLSIPFIDSPSGFPIGETPSFIDSANSKIIINHPLIYPHHR